MAEDLGPLPKFDHRRHTQREVPPKLTSPRRRPVQVPAAQHLPTPVEIGVDWNALVPLAHGPWHAGPDRRSDRPSEKHEQRPACRAAVRHLDEPANGEDVTDGRGPLAVAGGTHRVLADLGPWFQQPGLGRGPDRSGQDHGKGPTARIMARSMCNWPARRRTRPSPGQSTHSTWREALGDEPRPVLEAGSVRRAALRAPPPVPSCPDVRASSAAQRNSPNSLTHSLDRVGRRARPCICGRDTCLEARG